MDERLLALMDHLGVESVHIAGRMPGDWQDVIKHHKERAASLTLIAPTFIPPGELTGIAPRVTVFSSNLPMFGDWVAEAMKRLPQAEHLILDGYQSHLWADLVQDHGQQIGERLMQRMAASPQVASIRNGGADQESSGEVAGITYQMVGEGQPLFLMPLGLAPSGWQPLIDWLAERCCVIVLGGPELGMLPGLEMRGQSPGYTGMMQALFNRIELAAGDSILEIGSGTGVVLRWLAEQTAGKNPLTGLDLNSYLLGEAQSLVDRANLGNLITFQQGNAEALPLPDNQFDVIFSTTVMEEVHADKMLSEMIRVVKPGGWIGVVVRAMDMQYTLNIPLPKEDLTRFEDQPRRPEGDSCASASLYGRFQHSALENVSFGPHLASFYDGYGVIERFVLGGTLAQMDPADRTRWEEAIQTASDEGTFFFSWPHHLAVGRKPLR
ncbi:MAG: methyltransferase domain-containing protein [Chloroflexota bacterium]